MKLSEFRTYPFIFDSLKEMGWNTNPPSYGGDVFTQHEVRNHKLLWESLNFKVPENVVQIDSSAFWVIESKGELNDIEVAVSEAKDYADSISNFTSFVSKSTNPIKNRIYCPFATGVAGNPNSTYYIETHCKFNGSWKRLTINDRYSTGFVTKKQIQHLISTRQSNLEEYEIDDNLFRKKIVEINEILHGGGVNKRNRAAVLSCLLLALASDENISIQSNPGILIRDLNNRAEAKLKEFGKSQFFQDIKIEIPRDNGKKKLDALRKALFELKGINIASAINSGRDILGECYEQFLKYANDAKEIGIVLTPRHITNFAVNVLQIDSSDVCFDPACGTGGFLIGALDRVRRISQFANEFKSGNLFGIELDSLVATLSIVNMIFRGDGSSNIVQGNCFDVSPKRMATRVLMNPPFALKTPEEYEWRFVERGIGQAKAGALLFAILPSGVMGSADDSRKEISFRRQLLKRHRLLAVVKLPNKLFNPIVSKGTHAIIIKVDEPHKFEQDLVFWGILDDGLTKSKTSKDYAGNIDKLQTLLVEFVHKGIVPKPVVREVSCSLISEDWIDLLPEEHIDTTNVPNENHFNISDVLSSVETGRLTIRKHDQNVSKSLPSCSRVRLISLFTSYTKGQSGRKKEMSFGRMPLISTSEENKGICAFIAEVEAKTVYEEGTITISSNGGSCWAAYHDYKFAANPDVFVCELKPEYQTREFGLFLCSAIRAESWRYDYYRKFNGSQLRKLHVSLPVMADGAIDMETIIKFVKERLM